MFTINQLEDIIHSLKQNKLRNILTGFGVAWGIFILVILLGAGNGFQTGIMKLFGSFAQNSLWVYGGQSSSVEIGMTEGKLILFNEEDVNIIGKRFTEIESISPETTIPRSIVSFKENFGAYTIKGISEDYFKIKILDIDHGRTFNKLDNSEKRKVAIISNKIKKVLFKQNNAVGQFINISGTWFKVIGVLDEGNIFTQSEQNAIFIPFNSVKENYNIGNEFNTFGFTLKSGVNTKDFEIKLKKILANRIGFDRFDEKALFVLNFDEQIKSFDKLFNGIKAFLFFIGVCLLLSGIIGIGNIMLIVVKERTKEIGIRKAIGAKSNSIIMMILSESVVITFIAGLVGLLLGIGVTNLVNLIITQFYDKEDVLISNFGINIPIALLSMFLIVVSGCLAGLYPAKKAAEIMPVVAINHEQY